MCFELSILLSSITSLKIREGLCVYKFLRWWWILKELLQAAMLIQEVQQEDSSSLKARLWLTFIMSYAPKFTARDSFNSFCKFIIQLWATQRSSRRVPDDSFFRKRLLHKDDNRRRNIPWISPCLEFLECAFNLRI